LLEVDKKDRNIRALLRWNPVLTKAVYKIKMVNGTTKEWYRHDLIRTELIDDNRYVLAFWNPHEALDAVTGVIPILTVMGVVAGIVSHLRKREELVKKDDDGN
jgi:hypothetical protein